MPNFETATGKRPDLAAIPTNPYLGFIGERIMPPLKRVQKNGTIYYTTLTADSAAQSALAAGTVPTGVRLASSHTSWTTVRKNKRYLVSRDEAAEMGGIEIADRLGAVGSKRSVERLLEEDIADNVLLNGSATVDDIEASFIQTCQTGLNAIKRYPGKKAFVASLTVFNRIMRYTEIVNRFGLSSAAVSGADAMSIIAREPAALKLLLRAIIGVDEVLIGDDDQWYTSDAAKQDRAALVVLPDPGEESHRLDPVFGKVIHFWPQGETGPWDIESFYDSDDKDNKYDAERHWVLKTFNTGALYILDGIDESNTVTTTA